MNQNILAGPNRERGSILVVTLLILFALTAIGSTLALVSSTDLKISGNQRLTTEALTVAEAGLNEAIHRLSLRNPTTATVGGWTGNVAIGDAQPYDPNWEARIYLTDPGSAPAGGGSLATAGTFQNPGADYLAYSEAAGVDDVLSIRHKWEDRNGDSVRDANEVVRYDANQVPPENFTSGYAVEIVTVAGQRGNAERTIQAEVTRLPLSARTHGALYSNRPLSILGVAELCGHNHDFNTPAGTNPMACFAFHLGAGGLPGVATTGDDIDVGGAADALGDPVPTDSSSANPWYTLAEVLGVSQDIIDDVLANADNTTVVDPLDGITYINGDANVNANTVGRGLLYVTGDCDINGGFEYTGLIYIEGDLHFNGDGWVLGGIVVNGATDYGFSAGGAACLYSEEAIKQAIGESMPMTVLSWREL